MIWTPMIWTLSWGDRKWHPRAGIVILVMLTVLAIPGLIVHLIWGSALVTGLVSAVWTLLLIDID